MKSSVNSSLPTNPFEKLYYLWWPKERINSVTTLVQARVKTTMEMGGHDGDSLVEEDKKSSGE